jgi:hypothetical protein
VGECSSLTPRGRKEVRSSERAGTKRRSWSSRGAIVLRTYEVAIRTSNLAHLKSSANTYKGKKQRPQVRQIEDRRKKPQQQQQQQQQQQDHQGSQVCVCKREYVARVSYESGPLKQAATAAAAILYKNHRFAVSFND